MRRAFIAAIAAGTIVAGLVTSGGAVHAAVPGANGRIVFSRQLPTGGADVFTANPDGSVVQQVPLQDLAEDFGLPVWSPDGSKILISHTIRFQPSGDCCLAFRPAIVNPDGSNYTLLAMPNAPFDMDCQVWSLDATRLLCGFGGDHPGVFSVRSSDGGDPVRLSRNPYGNADQGAMDVPTDLSPDGQRFVFLRYRPGPTDRAQQVGIFVENVDGTGLRQIAPFGVARAHEQASARWSPDGRDIITSSRLGQLFVVHPNGAGANLIDLPLKTNSYFAFQPDFSPDGTQIIFSMYVSGGGGQADIYTANRDGSDLVQVTDTPETEIGPDWGSRPTLP